MKREWIVPVLLAGALTAIAAPARAQNRPIEIGASLAGVNVGLGVGEETTIGIPTTGIQSFNQGLYASVFLNSRVAIEPQLGFFFVFDGDDAYHVLNVAGQADYFLGDVERSSPYVFGSVGVVHFSGAETTPVSIGGGWGYRKRAGDRLTLRFDMRVTHLTEIRDNALAFGVSIGGLFGR